MRGRGEKTGRFCALRALAPGLVLASLGVPAAQAHSPHDIAAWIAVSPGPAPAWIATSLIRFDAWILVRTTDGDSLETRFLLPDTEEIGTAALLGPERLFLGTDGLGLWVSEDAGDSFQLHPDLPADATVRKIARSPAFTEDETALAAGSTWAEGDAPEGRVWRTEDAGRSWTAAATLDGLALMDLELSPDFPEDGRAFALTRDGQVLGSTDGGRSWTLATALPDTCWQVAVGEEQRVWVATDSRGLWRSDDDGASFTRAPFPGAQVTTVIDLGGGLVLATMPDQAVWRSTDGGESWDYQHDLIQRAGDGLGNPIDGNHYYDFLEDDTGTLWLASWEGITRSTDRGLTWQAIETYRPDALHGVSLTLREGTAAPTAVIGSNGGGIEWVDPSAGEAAAVGLTLPRPWPRMVHAGQAWTADTPIFATLSCGLVGSFDAGQTWASLAEDGLGGAEDVYLPLDFPTIPHVLAVGMVGSQPGWAFSTDGGHSFRTGTLDLGATPTPCNVAVFSDGYADDGLAWVACGSEGVTFETDDQGEHWTRIGAAGARMQGMAAAPRGEVLLLATLDGLLVSRDGGAPEPLAFAGEPVWDVVISPDWARDPAIFALAARSGWFRSDDGGESWTELPRPTEGVAQHLAISPGFPADQAVAVTSFEGAWLSLDRGERWQDAHAVEVIDLHHPSWRLSDGWEVIQDEAAVEHSYARAETAGATATGTFEGVGLALLGAPAGDDDGLLGVRLDGADAGTVDLGLTRDGAHPLLWSAWELEDGWHSVELTVLEGPCTFNAMEVLRQPFTLLDLAAEEDQAPREEDEGCQGRCQTGPWRGSALWLPALLLLARRRRRPLSGLPAAPHQHQER